MQSIHDPDFTDIELIYSTSDNITSVYSGFSISLNRPVVYKVIQYTRFTEQGIKRLQLEAKILRTLRSPNICQVYEWKDVRASGDRSFFCIVMEKLPKDWSMEIQSLSPRNCYPESDLWERLYVLVATLAQMQSFNLAHRDIKPQNILLTEDAKPRVKLADFDSCKFMDPSLLLLSIQGTPTYLSPKLKKAYLLNPRAKIEHDVFKSDVFSLGVTMLQAAMLRVPEFDRDRNVFQIWIENAISSMKYSSRFKDVVMRMLSDEEADRPDFLQLAEFLDVLPNISSVHPVLNLSPACYNCSRKCASVPFLRLPCHHVFAVCSATCFDQYCAANERNLAVECNKCTRQFPSSGFAEFYPQMRQLFRSS